MKFTTLAELLAHRWPGTPDGDHECECAVGDWFDDNQHLPEADLAAALRHLEDQCLPAGMHRIYSECTDAEVIADYRHTRWN